ncbi:hypothetical protein K502DRAFT_300073, partial [Neoconidiobolus thromboides FSU 785]
KIKRKSKEQPWVPLGVALTIGSFVGAYIKFRKGSRVQGVQFLRYRVAFQTLTIVGLLLGTAITTTQQVQKPIQPKISFDKVKVESEEK